MSSRVQRLEMTELRPDLASLLAPRVERLGYLGEFFRCVGHQPDALIDFTHYTESCKAGLDKRLVELIALTVASSIGNDYERNQHERLSVRLGFGKTWVAEVEKLEPDTANLNEDERALQAFVIAAVRNNGRGVSEDFDALVLRFGQERAIAVLLVIGRYLVHGLVVNAFGFAPPVPSIFEDGFAG